MVLRSAEAQWKQYSMTWMTRKSIKLFLSTFFCWFLREVNIVFFAVDQVELPEVNVTFDHDLHEISAQRLAIITCNNLLCERKWETNFNHFLAIFGWWKLKWKRNGKLAEPKIILRVISREWLSKKREENTFNVVWVVKFKSHKRRRWPANRKMLFEKSKKIHSICSISLSLAVEFPYL